MTIAIIIGGWLACAPLFTFLGWRAAKIRTPKPPRVVPNSVPVKDQLIWMAAAAKVAARRHA